LEEDGEFINPPLEKVLYFPYIKELNQLRYYVELVKPSLEHASIWSADNNKWKTLGEGEGASLGIAMRRVGIKIGFLK
jgi:hypothetical protein